MTINNVYISDKYESYASSSVEHKTLEELFETPASTSQSLPTNVMTLDVSKIHRRAKNSPLSRPTIDVPLRTDEHGVIRVGKTRVTLQTVIAAHLQDQTPQQIVEDFDVLKLEEVFAVITYYLTHKGEVDEYIHQQQIAGEKLRHELEAQHPEMFVLQEKFRRLLEEKNSEDKA